MQKISIVFAALLFLLAPLAAQAITMSSPNGGETLTLGATFPVTWTAAGVTQNVRLILLHEDNSIFGVIVRDLAPGGAPYNWAVARTEAGAAPAGRYKIRVSTMDGAVKDVSDAAFTIGDGSSPEPEPEPEPEPNPASVHDFMLSNPVLQERDGDAKGFRVRVTDLTGDFRGGMIFSFYCIKMGMGNAVRQRVQLDLRRGVPATVDLFNVLPAYFANECGMNFRFDVNPDRAVAEINYGNNAIQEKFFWNSRDGRFFSLRLGRNYTAACEDCAVVIRPADVESVSGETVRLKLEITVQNCGSTAIRGAKVRSNYSWYFRDAGNHIQEGATNVDLAEDIDIDPGHFRILNRTVTLRRYSGSTLTIRLECGESGALNANNNFSFHPNFVGF